MNNCNLFPWKNTLLLLCTGFILHTNAAAQCPGPGNLSVRTYDTVITGPGYGNYHLNFPRWPTDSGLLVSVRVNALVNVQYSFLLKNVDVLPGSYSIWVGREDLISSPSMSASYDNVTEQKIGVYPLNPGEQVASPPFPFLSNYNNVDSITGATSAFLGTGQVTFTYSPVTYTNIHTTNNASYNYHASATEVTRFSLSYFYCKDAILASGLTAFKASVKDPASVQLDWNVAGEKSDRLFEIQRSRDGVAFTAIGTLPADELLTSYKYIDRPGTWGKWYYRLRIVTPGSFSLSSIQAVDLQREDLTKLVLYPNPAVSHINLVLPGDPNQPGDWRVDIRASDGRLIQRADFFHTNTFFINFRQNLSPGVYFIRATDLQGHGSQVASFRVDAG